MANYIKHDHIPLCSAYVNLQKWPESDSRFRRSVSYKGGCQCQPAGVHYGQPRVVDTRSCRQMFLRSYPFSRKESLSAKTKKCISKVREIIKNSRFIKRSSKTNTNDNNIKRLGKRASCPAMLSIFRRLLFFTTKVDVAEYAI